MSQTSDLRRTQDRRSQPRGGRRPADVDGFAPLVMVVGDQAAVGDAVGAVLAKLRFAVSPAGTVDEALRALPSLRPDLIVAAASDAARIRLESPEYRAVVVVTAEMREDPQLLIEEIRSTIRSQSA